MTDLTTRVYTDLPASEPPAEPVQAERTPYVASTHDRDPFEVMGIDPTKDPDDDGIPF